MKVRLLFIVTIEIFSYCRLWSQSAEIPLGSGTNTDPYQISSMQNLYWLSISDSIWSDSCYFVQTADIDATETSEWNGGEGFTPIGTKSIPFIGEYNGKGHIVKGVYINMTNSVNVGLFGYAKSAKLDSLGILECQISGGQYVGGLLGYGRFVTISECYCNEGTIYGVYTTGGLVGCNQGSTVQSCFSFCNISGKGVIAGFIGANQSSNVSECYSGGEVRATGDEVAGFIGFNNFSDEVSNCYSRCSVSGGGEQVSGFIAHNVATETISNCYSTGFVSEGDGYYGGFIAYNLIATTRNCYFNAKTSGQKDAFGVNTEGSTVTNLSSAEMMQDTSFIDWDFEDVWRINNGLTFPRLRGVKNGPVILQDLKRFAHVDEVYSDTIRVVQMDAVISSVELLEMPSGMRLVQDSIIVWTPKTKQDTVVKIEAIDQNGLKDVFSYQIKFSPFSGSGEKDDPFLISSLQELDSLSNNNYYWSFFFEQTDDINAAETVDWNDGEGFLPIGNNDYPFKGSYSGNGFKIDSLYINQPDNSYVGLFGYAKNAVIDSVNLSNCEITGSNFVGGILGYGYKYSQVSQCSVSGLVTGEKYVGGLLGYCTYYSVVNCCYTMGNVSGTTYVGGLLGYSKSNTTVSDNYSTASVTGNKNVGGLVGGNNESNIEFCYCVGAVYGDEFVGNLLGCNFESSIVSNCFFSSEIKGANIGIGKDLNAQSIDSLSVLNMKKESSFEDWDFTDVWEIKESVTFPRLRSVYDGPVILQNLKSYNMINSTYCDTIQVVQMDAVVDSVCIIKNISGMTLKDDSIIVWTPEGTGNFTVGIKAIDSIGVSNVYIHSIRVYPFEGEGTEDDPFKIKTLTDLDSLSNNNSYWSFYFMQTADINASETREWNQGSGFSPIGNNDIAFTGSYRGNGSYINGLYINRTDENNVGLFGNVSEGEIDSLFVLNVDIAGLDYTGGIAGCISSATNLSECILSGNVSGNDYVGGLVGGNCSSSIIKDCYCVDSITGNDYVGGLVGINTSYSEVVRSYALAYVSGEDYTAGLVGKNYSYSVISNCYSSGYAIGDNEVGGLVGVNSRYSKVTDSYSLSSVVGDLNVGGLIGYNSSSGERVSCCYSVGKVVGDRNTGGFIGYNYSSSTILNSFCNRETSGQSVSIGQNNGNQVVDSLSILEMKDSINFTDFNFTDTWEITEGVTFPRLQNVYDKPVILQNLKTFVKVNNLYSDTIRVVQMDEAIDSVYLLQKATGMTLKDDSIIVWTPESTGNFVIGVTAVDINGVVNNYIDTIRVNPFVGAGSENEPFRISNLADLDTLSSNSKYWGDYFIQIADIDASATANWNDGSGFSPIGNSEEVFTGFYNGAGHFIDSICIRRSEENYVGLFKYTLGANIDSLALTNCNIEGGKYVGALLGFNTSSDISNCYVSGRISGDTIVGAIAGCNNGSVISNCYNVSRVSGIANVGGLAGNNVNSSTVEYCYNAGFVQGSINTGGVVGYNFSNSEIEDCFYYNEVSENSGVGKDYNHQSVKALSLLEMKDSSSFEKWDFDNDWEIEEGISFPRLKNVKDGPVVLHDITLRLKVDEALSDTVHVISMDANIYSLEIIDMPSDMKVIGDTILLWNPSKSGDYKVKIVAQDNNGLMNILNYTISVELFEGKGTASDPYRIETLADLDSLANQSDYWSSCFIQTADIDASATVNWNGGKGLNPVGNSDVNFTGCYNGKGHIIDGLFMNSPALDYVGLFGYVYDATIDSIGFVNCNINGNYHVGGLVAYAEASDIFNSYSSGVVSGGNCVGGLVGNSASSSSISNCYSMCKVSGINNIGGLIGVNEEGSLVGKSYSAGLVTGSEYVGGFIGYSDEGDLSDCYFNIETSQQTEALGSDTDTNTNAIPSLTISSMKNPNSYYTWNFWDDWEIDAYVSFPKLNDVKDAPFIVQDLSEEMSLGEEYRDTIHVVQMDGVIDSITLIKSPDGMSLEDDSILVWIPSEVGVDSVQVAAIDVDGLKSIFCYSITVAEGDIDNYGNSRISAYPNPVVDNFKIEGIYFKGEAFIYKLTGEQVYYKTGVTSNTSIDISNLETGIYILKLKDSKGVASSVLVKE